MSEVNKFVQVILAAQVERARRLAERETREQIARARQERWAAMVRETEGRAVARGRA
jgi:hypothetical protein